MYILYIYVYINHLKFQKNRTMSSSDEDDNWEPDNSWKRKRSENSKPILASKVADNISDPYKAYKKRPQSGSPPRVGGLNLAHHPEWEA